MILFGQLELANNVPVNDAVRLGLATPAFSGSSFILTDETRVIPDNTGFWSFADVDLNSGMDTTGTQYLLTLPGEDPVPIVLTGSTTTRQVPGAPNGTLGVWFKDAVVAPLPTPPTYVVGIPRPAVDGTVGQVPEILSVNPLVIGWRTVSGGGAVASVFGREGAVEAEDDDYSIEQITGLTEALAELAQSITWDPTPHTANFTASANHAYLVHTPVGGPNVVVTLPGTGEDGDVIILKNNVGTPGGDPSSLYFGVTGASADEAYANKLVYPGDSSTWTWDGTAWRATAAVSGGVITAYLQSLFTTMATLAPLDSPAFTGTVNLAGADEVVVNEPTEADNPASKGYVDGLQLVWDPTVYTTDFHANLQTAHLCDPGSDPSVTANVTLPPNPVAGNFFVVKNVQLLDNGGGNVAVSPVESDGESIAILPGDTALFSFDGTYWQNTGGTYRGYADYIFTLISAFVTGQLQNYAPRANPVMTGHVTVPDPTNGQDAANMRWTQAQIAAIVNSAPDLLNTLKELADALGDDPNFATTMTNALAGKQPLAALLTALGGVGAAANTLPYFTSGSAAAVTSLTAFARSLIGAADAPTARGTLGLGAIATHAATDYLPARRTPTGTVVEVTNADVVADVNANGLLGVAAPGTPLTRVTGDGTTNDQPAFKAWVAYLGTVYVAKGCPMIMHFPAGTYSIRDAGTIWASGVGMIGDGPGATVFTLSNPISTTNPVPLATFTTAQQSASVTNYLADCYFAGFTVDGAGVALSAYNVGAKAFALQFMVRPTFRDVVIQNCGASGLGIDHLVDAYVDNVRCYRNGRLNSGTDIGGAGIGIGVGGWVAGGSSLVEGGRFVGCVGEGNGTHGIFFELQNTAWVRPRGYSVIGGSFRGNRYGISDWGCDGLQLVGVTSTDNILDGLNVSQLGVGSQAGQGGRVLGCVFDGNGRDGVLVGDFANNYYFASGTRCSNNCRYGFHVLNSVQVASQLNQWLGTDGIEVYNNALDGIRIDAGTNYMSHLSARVRNNGQQSAATGSSTGTGVVYTGLTLTDPSAAWAVNGHVGKTVTAGGVTAIVRSNTATVLTLWPTKANGTTAWSGTTPTNGASYSIPAAATQRAALFTAQGCTHPIVRGGVFTDTQTTKTQTHGWINSSTWSSSEMTENDFQGNTTIALLSNTPSGGRWINNAGLAAAQLSGPSNAVIDGPLVLGGYVKTLPMTTSQRNVLTAATAGAGAHVFDSTLGKPIWSNGTNWVDATGATV